MSTRYYRDAAGRYIGAFGPGVPPPEGGIEIPAPPFDARAVWDGAGWIEPPPPPPAAITRRQLRLWLVRHGHALAQVEALIDALPEPQRTETRIEWQDATQFERVHPLLRQLAGALLGLSGQALAAALDQAFREAIDY